MVQRCLCIKEYLNGSVTMKMESSIPKSHHHENISIKARLHSTLKFKKYILSVNNQVLLRHCKWGRGHQNLISQLWRLSHWCFHANVEKIHPVVEKILYIKKRPRIPKSNCVLNLSQWHIHATLMNIHSSIQEISPF